MQIKRYVERDHRRNQIGRHMQLLKTLPDGMVRELFHEAHSSILHSHAFFREIGEGDSSMEMNLCSNAVSEAHVLHSFPIASIWTHLGDLYQAF